MPGAGKSTVGVVLAKRLRLDFLDTDVLLQTREGASLQEIINGRGMAAFGRIEEDILCRLEADGTVIATGGSAVYSDPGMGALKKNGTVVFLDLPLAELEARIKDMDSRGLVIAPGETFSELYAERLPLYRRWADHTVDCRGRSVEEIATEVEKRLA
jgi:shikimate kinase